MFGLNYSELVVTPYFHHYNLIQSGSMVFDKLMDLNGP